MAPSRWGSEAHDTGHSGDGQGPGRVKKHRGESSPAGLGTGSGDIVDVGVRVVVKVEGELSTHGWWARRSPSAGLQE